MSTPALHGRDFIAARLPHAGDMCLLDELHEWDERRIVCLARTHRSASNPLRSGGRLGAACAAEYAAQAMALHGALLAERASAGAHPPPRAPGMLAALRALTLHVADLDHVGEPLAIACTRLDGDARTQVYDFEVRGGATRIAGGRATLLAGVPS